MKPESFSIFAKHLKHTSGLIIRPDQDYLLHARLSSLLELYHCADLDALAQHVAFKPDATLSRHITDAMATHETSFMRDASVFAYFQKTILPALMLKNASSKRLRLWSAGCAGGQEPYSLAMLLHEHEDLNDWMIDIVATDVSFDIIERAKQGLYSHFEAQRGLPVRLLLKYFTQEETQWRISDTVKRDVRFHTMNMLDDFSQLGQFDAVFCRNVLIYVDADTRHTITTRFYDAVKPNGFLVLGAIEAFLDQKHLWQDESGITGVFKRR